MSDRNSKIAVFDSGVGGLTVLKELIKIMPDEEYIYLADLKNSPYGDKDGETIEKLSRRIIEYFIKLDVKMIIVACNTASSYNIDKIKKDYDTPILTVVEAAINSIDKNDKNILLAATKATVDAGTYDKLIGEMSENINLYKEACVDIVPSIENKNLNESEIRDIVDSYIKKYRNKDIELLVLGCTHYPIWADYFSQSIGEGVNLLDPAFKLAEEAYNRLKNLDLLAYGNKGSINYLVTDNKESFFRNANTIIDNVKFEDISIVNL